MEALEFLVNCQNSLWGHIDVKIYNSMLWLNTLSRNHSS
uniref:Uncharacterized protein n=1 Tax=Rhizophora mucronata TaxID=61149 RepID=A0A2P2R358_RHIMU